MIEDIIKLKKELAKAEIKTKEWFNYTIKLNQEIKQKELEYYKQNYKKINNL